MDIVVEGQCLIIKGEREVKRGSNVSKRVFNQKFDLPVGAEVDKITSEYKLDGKLVVSVPAAAAVVASAQSSEAVVSQQQQPLLLDYSIYQRVVYAGCVGSSILVQLENPSKLKQEI